MMKVLNSYHEINRMAMKSSYQRNMFLAHLVVIILIVLPVWIWSTISTSSEKSSPATYTNIKVIDLTMQTSSQSPATKRNIGGQSKLIKTFHGQFGVKVSIILDNPVVIIETPKVYTLDPDSNFTDEYLSISDLDTGVFGTYLPEDANYEFDDPFYSVTTVELINKASAVISKIDPNYPFVAERAGK